MNLVKVLPILFLHVLSLEFSRLPVTSDSCQRLLRSAGFEPNCKFEISKSAGPLEVSCPEAEVLRIVGNYDVIRIDCQAPYLFDFDFTGNKPTEAIVPKFYRQLNASSERWRYHIQVLIYGLNALALVHHDSQERKHNYSRTGRFSFPGMGSFNRFAKSFYIFLEEPEISGSFIANRDTERPKFEENNVCVSIPCLSTHYDSVVSLASPQAQLPGIHSVYSRTKGLHVCGLSSQVEAFVCQLEEEDGSIRRKTVQNYPPPYGIPRPLGLDESAAVKIRYISKWRDSATAVETNAECTGGSGSSLASIGASNAASYALLRDFVLPAFQNRSYTVLIGRRGAGERLATSATTALVGATYCENAGKYRLASFIVDFEPSVAVADFDIDWGSFFGASPSGKYSKIWPDGSKELEKGSYVDFTCLFNGFLFVSPAIWHVGTADGQVRREILNSHPLENGISVLRLQITEDLQNLTCNAPVWYKSYVETARATFTRVTKKRGTTTTTTLITATTTTTAAPGTTRTTAPSTIRPTSNPTIATSPVMPGANSNETESRTSTTTTVEPTSSSTSPEGDMMFLIYGIIPLALAGLLLYFSYAYRQDIAALCGVQYDVAAAFCPFGSTSPMTSGGHPAELDNDCSSSPALLAVGPPSGGGLNEDANHLKALLSPETEELKCDLGSFDNKALSVLLAPLVSSEETIL